MKRTIPGMSEAGGSLLHQALQAARAVDEGQPAGEIENFRLEADHLHYTVIDNQLHKAGELGQLVH